MIEKALKTYNKKLSKQNPRYKPKRYKNKQTQQTAGQNKILAMSQNDIKIPLDSLKKIHKYFTVSGESLCVAESCTGGLLSFYLTHLPGASKYFKGALVSYQREVKIAQLGLKEEKIKKEGLVTKDCALSMAQGVKKLLNANWAVSITGIAGPDKGDLGETVGKIAFSVSSPYAEKSSIRHFKGPKRKDIRRQSAFFALDFLISGFK